ncbi:YadA-like family protein, partial [Vreelandella nigrificans]
EANEEGNSNIITKLTDDETLELALSNDLEIGNSITVGDTFIDGDSITTNNVTVNENLYVDGSTTINENLTVEGETRLGDNFFVNNEGNVTYTGDITEGDHITNKAYVDNSVAELGDTPLTFGANEGEDTERRLGDRLDIVGEANEEGNSNIITKLTDDETLELALSDDLEIGNSITVGDTFIDGDSITTNNVTVNENLTVAGETRLGDNFFVNNEGNVTYTGEITEGDHITNKAYVDNSVTELGDTPLTFGANEGEDTERRLGDRLDIVGEANEEGNSNIITKLTDDETLELALSDDLEVGNSITVGDTFIDGDSITTNNMTVNENLTVAGETRLGDNFFVNNEGNVTYTGEITEGDHITNKQYVDNSVNAVSNTPLTFGANEGDDTERRLGDRLDIVGEADEEGNSNIITKLTDEQTLELALNDDLKIVNSITVGESGPVISGDGISMSDTKITNLAEGEVSEGSQDGINGSQLYATNQWIENLESNVTNIVGDSSDDYMTNNGRGIRYVRTNDSGLAVSDAFAQGQGSTAVGYEAIASADRALAMGYDAIASHQGSVALGEGARTTSAVGTAAVEIAGQTYQFAGASPVATVSVGSVGAERTVTNVAAGRISAESTDAINGSQLHATNQAVGDLDDRVTNVEGDISNITNDLADLGDRAVQYDRNDDGSVDYTTITLEGDGGTTITNVAAGDISQSSSDAVNGSQLWDVQNQITNIEQGGSKYFRANSDGPAADPQGADSIAMGASSVAAGDRSVASGAGAQATAEGSVALGADSVADREGMNGERERFSNEAVASTQGAVSVGSAGNERQITNVAGGTQDTDAVNVRQLDAVQRGAVNYDRDESGNIDYSTITLKGDEGTTITNVAPGINTNDAVNLGQMQELSSRFENEILNVHGRIDNVERNANAGSASAIAASTVPQAWMPGKSMVGVGAGTYGGESAVSVGVSRLSDNGRWVIQGKVTGDSQSNFGAGIGAGWHW